MPHTSRSTRTTVAARTKVHAAIAPWTLIEVDEPSSRWTSAIQALVAADKIPYKKKPRLSKSSDPEREKVVLSITPTPANLGLPAGTLHLERRATPLPVAKPKPNERSFTIVKPPPLAHTTHWFVVPDGASTWLAVGDDAKIVAAHVKTALAGGTASGTLKGKPELERFAAQRLTSGQFASIGWFALAVADANSDSDIKEASGWLDKLARLPARGETPFELDITPIAASGGTVGGRTFTWRVPRAVLGDIAKAF